LRRCILQDCPRLLDSLLHKATTDDSHSSQQYYELCLQLLCEPLLASVPLPASAEKFFICVVDQAIQSPSTTTLCRVYDLLTGACQGLPRILPQDTWAGLEHGLITIVGNARTIQDQSVSLTCLGVIYALAVPSGTLRGLTQSQVVHSELTTDIARAFFSGGKALKSLSLAALQAAWSCKPSSNFSFGEVLRSLDIVLNIFLVVGAKVRSAWSKSREGQSAISRLMSKATEEGLDLEFQMRLFAILGTVVDSDKVPTEIMATAGTMLLNARFRWSDRQGARDMIVLFLEGFGSKISHEAWTELLGEMLKLATYSPTKVPTPELRNMCLLSQTIGDSLSQIPSLRKALSSAFSTLQDNFVLQRFLKEVLKPASCGSEECCNATSLEARRALGCSLASLYLGTALSSGSQLKAEMANNSLRMLAKLQQLASRRFSCDDTTPSSRAALMSFVEAKCSQDARNAAQDWKGRLSTYTRLDAKHQEKSLIRLVGEICHDLEERCATAEEPLRQEQERSKQLQQEIDMLAEEKSILQEQHTESSMHVESLERQKIEIEACLSEEQSHAERLFSRAESLERNLRETKEAAEEELRQVRESANEREMELRASLGAHKCTVEDLEEELEEFKGRAEGLEKELEVSKKAGESFQKDLKTAETNLSKLEGNLKTLRQSFKDSQAQLEIQSLVNKQIKTEMQTVEDKNNQVLTELSDLHEKHQDLIAQSDRQRAGFEVDIEKAKQQVESLILSHNLAVEEMSTSVSGPYNVRELSSSAVTNMS
jgi:predicted  nucleic acid-binding Zn-ribbon protein